jgi:putative spermidine/putrescine transport system ATP-binding protein
VFQHYALFPHMTVAQNVAYPLKQRRVPKAERAAQVREALDLVELGDLGERRPAQLSGGQQQRVALARALVFRPPVLLMDEPLGALDKRLRETLQLGIKQLHEELGITFVYVTHDQDEALLLSDRIAVFNAGRIEQADTAEELYERPATRFVAEFLGDSNIFTGALDAGGGAIRLDGGDAEVRVADCRGARPGEPVAVMVRPERVRVVAAGDGAEPGANRMTGVVGAVRYVGSARKVELEAPDGRRLLAHTPADRPLDVSAGDRAEACWRPEDCVVIGTDAPEDDGADNGHPAAVQAA